MKGPISLLLTLLTMLACTSTSLAQDSLNVTQRSIVTLTWGETSRVAIQGNYAYIASGRTGLRIMDIGNPAHPVEIGYCDTPGSANGVAVSGNYAYVADMMCDLRIIDVSSPAHPFEIARLETGTMAYDVECDGDYAYVVDRWEGLKIVDIADPLEPFIAGSWSSSMSNVLCVEVEGDVAYVGCGSQGVVIIDVQEPEHAAALASIQTPSVPVDIFVIDDYAYVVASGLRILDVTESTEPQLMSVVSVTGGARAVVADHNYAYVPTYSNGVRIFDISIPDAPSEISSFPIDGQGKDVALFGENACVIDNGMRIADVSNPVSPSVVGFYLSRGENQRVTLAGDYVYSASGCGGLKITHITASEMLEVVGVHYPSSPNDVAVVGHFAYVADEVQGLMVIDISDPESPALIECCATPGNTKAIEVAGHHAYLADYAGGLRVIDIADPSNPTEVATCPTTGYAKDIALQGNHAFVIDGAIRTFDISDPTNPILIGGYSGVEVYNGITLLGDFAYATYLLDVSNGIFGLRVFDISYPREPSPCGSVITLGGEYAYSLKAEGEYVYLANGIAGLQVYDVCDPYNPCMIGYYSPSHSEARGLDVREGRVFLADENYVRVLDYLPITIVESKAPEEIPSDFGISFVYPNPFNSTTNVGFRLQKASRISLIICDIQGRQVAVLAHGLYASGIHRRLFDASNLSSGTYFLSLTSKDFQHMKRLTFVK